jgi:dTDP-4-dehydrorhamnose reductase
MKVLILGSKGQLGHCLFDQFSSSEYELIYSSREEIDISNLDETKLKIVDINPSVVINSSAYTNVDKAEDKKQEADLINHLAVANIANICKELECWLIHISTDYVFDGAASQPYQENDITNPQSIYGASKLNGEHAVQSSGCKYLIVRTSWLFSEYGNNFLKTMLKLGSSHNELSLVGDQIGSPTYAQDLAKAVVQMLNYFGDESIVGLYHFSGSEQCSWFQFGNEIFSRARELGFSSPDIIHEITTEDYPTPATRPAYSVLDNHKSLKVFGIMPSDWSAGISKALAYLYQDSPSDLIIDKTQVKLNEKQIHKLNS